MKKDWDTYFLDLLPSIASRSNCIKRQVGAIIVSQDNQILSTGYNGSPRGILDCNKGGCERCNDPSIKSGEALDKCICSHAEENAIVNAARYGISIKNSIIYINLSPCLGCSKLIINSGIKEVHFNEKYWNSDFQEQMLENAKIKTIVHMNVAPKRDLLELFGCHDEDCTDQHYNHENSDKT